ncbi:hypothetical protein AJ80_06218 [Polytolypa hystricis UAMH7299]|uniref:DUF676 domain-containing protein n=1 Tax=Polytolypa hystricis (strain UAMH7299) TaxID=1447883 RepID=A0A2B7XY57_POLH7|nr:hypothetical protein AJ80_06218 [Polytolypa hystricis UAMH7299]
MEKRKVLYIPPQADPLAATSPPTAHNNPLVLGWRDLRTLLSIIHLLPNLWRPYPSNLKSDELSLEPYNFWYLVALALISVVQAVLFLIGLVAFILLPGFISIPVCIAAAGLVWIVCRPIQGPAIVYSNLDGKEPDNFRKRDDERWVFINGILDGNRGLQRNCNRLALLFGRPIVGIHNPTYGLLGDLIECIVQRAFSYNTFVVRFAYDYIKQCLTDPTARKVVLICHSQGGIITSMVLDLLFADLPIENVSKLEVYTFGSAASHFNNPLISLDPASPIPSANVIKHIEHYVNSDDIVPRWGILYNIRPTVESRFSGRIFVRKNATGHMFNQHYLNNMFPVSPADEQSDFLDQIVEVDDRTATDRETCAIKHWLDIKGVTFDENGRIAGESGLEPVKKAYSTIPSSSYVAAAVDAIDRCHSGVQGESSSGILNKVAVHRVGRVRDLSRLWKYTGGGDPDAGDGDDGDGGERHLVN